MRTFSAYCWMVMSPQRESWCGVRCFTVDIARITNGTSFELASGRERLVAGATIGVAALDGSMPESEDIGVTNTPSLPCYHAIRMIQIFSTCQFSSDYLHMPRYAHRLAQRHCGPVNAARYEHMRYPALNVPHKRIFSMAFLMSCPVN